ncbi:MFS transporter, DHA1 family, bicyclomycin/chloramphenicol resistance protein [Robiginitalea myxolifaciens]|uniref:MFS transporter, DHA1 family, bicyclomycin/chloramphenicol resistance protein n=2 Tax=Robiginitalea myxolifaciens TaxID=400055 RepID=A0A1I6GYJ3_9FLAO|nr:MFS transporter, DHA1 family, bicyclomycin/chloramphenicol resistance protein [Robiginitalea myxolifaciens]
MLLASSRINLSLQLISNMQERSNNIEFIALMAALMSIVALALDALLPALDIIGLAIGNTDPTNNQLLITLFFLGMGTGPLLFGPLSDSLGRKPIVYAGFVFFLISSFICVVAESLELMIIGRILQGISLSAPRTISIAMIRDRFSGDYMARIMSFVTVVFILVPIIAPAFGKLVLDTLGWEAIFYVQVIFSLIVGFWFWKRQPETLPEPRRSSFKWKKIWSGFLEIVGYRRTMIFTFIWGLVTGSFLVYLSTSQQIFEVQYRLPDLFPYLFAGLALTVGASTLLNGNLVLRFGMRRLIGWALLVYTLNPLVYSLVFSGGSNPHIAWLMLFLGIQFFSVGFLFGNLRSMAMEPLGHIAGIGAAITGFLATVMSVPISAWIGKYVINSALPLFLGFLICGMLAVVAMGYSNYRYRQEND